VTLKYEDNCCDLKGVLLRQNDDWSELKTVWCGLSMQV
jgi:hypothetical protein